MSTQSSHGSLAALGALAAAVAAFTAYQYAHAPASAPARAIDAVPSAAFLVAEIDVDALRAAPAFRSLTEGRAAEVAGVARLRDACGFDPLDRTHSLVVAIPEADMPGEIGIAARVDVARADLARCTEALTGDGGAPRAARREGDFAVLDGERAQDPSYAYHPSGLLLVAGREWLAEMTAAASGEKARVATHTGHAVLREALAPKGGAKPALTATVVLPEPMRQRLRNEMGPEASDDEEAATMRAVLGVTSAGLALGLAAPGSEATMHVELTCDEAASCARVRTLIEKQRLSWSQDVRARMLGLGPLIDAMQVSAEGNRVSLTSRMATDALGAAIGRALRFARPRTAPRPERPADLHSALERIEARRDGGVPRFTGPSDDGGVRGSKPAAPHDAADASDGPPRAP